MVFVTVKDGERVTMGVNPECFPAFILYLIFAQVAINNNQRKLSLNRIYYSSTPIQVHERRLVSSWQKIAKAHKRGKKHNRNIKLRRGQLSIFLPSSLAKVVRHG